jgi:hypothetical protein
MSMARGLDIQTEKGKESMRHERRAVEIFLHHYPGWLYAETPKDAPAIVDAALVDESGGIVGLVEQKSREMTFETLASWGNEWLVTTKKIVEAREAAMALCVPLVGFLYLIPEDALVIQRITNADGSRACPIRSEKTTTQATINGGVARRANCFIDLSGASWFTIFERGSLPSRRAA